jgi:transglutaminase-like putative cysteine protease
MTLSTGGLAAASPDREGVAGDPTDYQVVDERHRARWGRDYANVSRLRSIIYSESEGSAIAVAVGVAPIERNF